MSIGRLIFHRPWHRILTITGLIVVVGFLLRCGSDDKKTAPPPSNLGPDIPADWDGNSDWTGSTWKVTTE